MKISEEELRGFTKTVLNSITAERENNLNFVNFYRYVFDKCLTDDDITALRTTNHNIFNFANLRVFLLHGLKGVIDSDPTINYKAIDENEFDDHPQLTNSVIADQLTAKLEEINEATHMKRQFYNVAKDQYVGAKGVFKVETAYINDYNFDQTLRVEHVHNPTKIFFDPSAKSVTKNDARWMAEQISMSQDQFKELFPNISLDTLRANQDCVGSSSEFSWLPDGGNRKKEKMVNIIEYYFYKTSHENIYEYENGEVTDQLIEGAEIPFKTRKIAKKRVWRVRYCGTQLLNAAEKTVFHKMPFVFASAETYQDLEGKTHNVSYAKHGFDSMRSKNFIYNYYMKRVLNNPAPTVRVDQNAITKPLMEAVRAPQEGKIQIYKGSAVGVDGTGNATGGVVDVPSPPLPNELLEAANEMDKNLSTIFGTQFPSLDDLTNVSGKALYNLSQYMSASTEILMENLLESLAQVADVIKDALPEILKSEALTLSHSETGEQQQVMFDYLFTPSRYRVVGQRGVSSRLQKEANFENLIGLSKEVPSFGGFLQTPPVMEEMLQMLDLQNEPKWLKLWTDYQQQITSSQQNNPGAQQEQQAQQLEAEKVAATTISANAKMLDARTRSSALPENQRQAMVDDQLELMKIRAIERKTDLHTQLETAKLVEKKQTNLLKHRGA